MALSLSFVGAYSKCFFRILDKITHVFGYISLAFLGLFALLIFSHPYSSPSSQYFFEGLAVDHSISEIDYSGDLTRETHDSRSYTFKAYKLKPLSIESWLKSNQKTWKKNTVDDPSIIQVFHFLETFPEYKNSSPPNPILENLYYKIEQIVMSDGKIKSVKLCILDSEENIIYYIYAQRTFSS